MQNLKGKKVLVTGAGGFCGSHVVERLIAEGAVVRAMFKSNAKSSFGLLPLEAVHEVEPRFADITDADAVRSIVKGQDIVLHLAAIISIPYSYEHPGETVSTNVLGTLNVLKACHDFGVQRVVITSTSEVYGSAENLPITEAHPLKPQSPYAASKVAADAIARSFYCSYGLPVVTLRPFNMIGARQSSRAVIPNVIKQVLWRKDKIEIGALHTYRDFVNAKDVARGFVLAADPETKIDGEVIQLPTNEMHSVKEVIDLIQKLGGTNLPVVVSEFRLRPTQSEVLQLKGSFDKAKRLFDWEPKISFQNSLEEMFEYVREHRDQYDPKTYAI